MDLGPETYKIYLMKKGGLLPLHYSLFESNTGPKMYRCYWGACYPFIPFPLIPCL